MSERHVGPMVETWALFIDMVKQAFDIMRPSTELIDNPLPNPRNDLRVERKQGIPTLSEYHALKAEGRAAAADYIGTDVDGYPDFYSEADVEAYIASNDLHEVDQHALRAMTLANMRDVVWIKEEDQRMAKVQAAMAKR